jgi:DNA-binding Xre family transcriptional regulator
VQTRSLKFNLKSLIEQKFGKTKLVSIADDLGISDTTLRKYMRNEALTFERRVLERICDYLDIGIQDLFELVPCDFFPHSRQLTVLRAKSGTAEDYDTLAKLTGFLSQNGIHVDEETCGDPTEINGYLKNRDCAIVGSPRNNISGPLALCELFQADPADTSRENRRKLPFIMRVPEEWHDATALMEHATESPRKSHLLVAANAENLAEKQTKATADYYPKGTFETSPIEDALDFGIVLVADRLPSHGQAAVRTYWLTGFTSVGAAASTNAIESELRSFNIEKPGDYVLAVIQAKFSKPANSNRRTLKKFEIVHTLRGTLPAPLPAETAVPMETAVRVEAVNDVAFHSGRRQKLQSRIQQVWRRPKPPERPKIELFYDSDMRDLSDAEFAVVLTNLPTFDGLPANQRQVSIEEYLDNARKAKNAVRKARDKGPTLFE